MSTSLPRFSDKDQKLLKALLKHPEKDSPKELADATGLPHSTVSKRIRKLRDEGVITTAIHLESRFPHRALISIHLDLTCIDGGKLGYSDQPGLICMIRERLGEVKEFQPFVKDVAVEDVLVLLGGLADLCAIVAGKDVKSIYDFVTKVLHALPAVKNTNTAAIVPSDLRSAKPTLDAGN